MSTQAVRHPDNRYHRPMPAVSPSPVSSPASRRRPTPAAEIHPGVYALILVVLVFGLLQTTRTLFTSLHRIGVLVGHQAAVTQRYEQSMDEQRLLKNDIHLYSSRQGIEELARNKLQWVGQDEILVRLIRS